MLHKYYSSHILEDQCPMIGVLVTLAKCDPNLLSGVLLPLVSSLQLLIWLEFEQIDHGQNYGFDDIGAWKLLEEDRQELLKFNQWSYRRFDFQEITLRLWLGNVISPERQSQILEHWDTHQFDLIPEESRDRALRIRALFEQSNWQREENRQEGSEFVFTLPENAEADAEAQRALLNLQHFQMAITCRKILDRKQEKTLELHNDLVALLTSKEQFDFLKKNLESQAFYNVIWAAITIILEPPFNVISQELEIELNHLTKDFINRPIYLDHRKRAQFCNIDASAFIAHVAPRLLKGLQTDSSILMTAFRCLIGLRNQDTCSFMRSWVREYGLESPLTWQLINVVPRISRLISLTYGFACIKHIQKITRPDGSYIVPGSEDINIEVIMQEDLQIKESWLTLQSDFAGNRIQFTTIINALDWIPEILIEPIQQMPDWAQQRYILNYFDWEFLSVALVPIMEVRIGNDEVQRFVNSLHKQVISAFLHERACLYEEHKATQRENMNVLIGEHLDESIEPSKLQLLDVIIQAKHTNILAQIKDLFCASRKIDFIDCILLKHIINSLISHGFDRGILEVNYIDFKCRAAFLIGDYLLECRTQIDSELRVLGEVNDVWEKLIELVSPKSKSTSAEDIDLADQSIVKFFSRFQSILFPHWWLRRKLYSVAQLVGYKWFRRAVFKTLVQHENLLPNGRNDESEILVQVLVELWDSDHKWIVDDRPRCQDLGALLGHLQEIDAVGARALADQVTSSLMNP